MRQININHRAVGPLKVPSASAAFSYLCLPFMVSYNLAFAPRIPTSQYSFLSIYF